MSDFDAFESAAPAGQEEDPAAAFLAGEQDKLAQLEDENFGVENQSSDQNAFGGDALFDQPPADTLAFDEPPADSGASTGADLFDPMAEPADAPNTDDNTFFDSAPAAEPEANDAYAAIATADKLKQEPEKIKIWREEQKKRLEEKDAEAEERQQEWREVATKELEDWYRHRAEQLEKTKVTNREAEEAFTKERDEKIPGHEWERICRLCDFNPKGQRNTKDVARMRSILLQLKQTPLVR